MIGKCREVGGIFIFSQAHVEECKASRRPQEFVRILESLDAYYLRSWDDTQFKQTLESKRASDLILAPPDATDLLVRQFSDSINVLNFAIDGLGSLEADSVLNEIANDLESAWIEMSQDIPFLFRWAFDAKREEAINLIRNFPAQQFRDQMAPWKKAFRSRLPQNLAQLDNVPAEKVIDYMVGLLDDESKSGFVQEFPRDFLKRESHSFGVLTGFAFMLFALDLVRDKRTKSGILSKRHQHFLGQFRDCQHIEYASRCDVFLTNDKGAARLAKSIFSYAGTQTAVWHLTTSKGLDLGTKAAL